MNKENPHQESNKIDMSNHDSDKDKNNLSGFDGKDYIVRATALDHSVRAIAVRSTITCQEMTSIHNLSPIASAALGRLCTGLMMMSQEIKDDKGSISAIIHCDGPIKGLTAVCTSDAKVRGYVIEPIVETLYKKPGKLDVGSAVGKGDLTIIKDTGIGEPYIGRIELLSGEIAEDLAAYYVISEQMPSVVSLGVKMNQQGVTHAGGLIVQLLPDAGEDITNYIEERALGFPEISWLYEEGFTPEQVIDLFFGDPDIEYYEPHECGYKCNCSEDRMARNLITIGSKDLKDLSRDPNGITLECHFCNHKYHFNQTQVEEFSEQTVIKAEMNDNAFDLNSRKNDEEFKDFITIEE